MPSGIHEVEIDVPIENVWEFVSDMNHWAPLVPGYIEHDILNDRESTWKFKGDLGIIQKTVNLKIIITEWQKPTKVTFDLKGLSENFDGEGYFKAEALAESTTKITGNLSITAGGLMAKMINPVLKSFVPKTAKELTEAIAEEITKIEATN
ncbi:MULTISPECIES: CoxG family protein [Virgibacillus]|uniref:SRPBCC family protein n=2 Tax=Virgibacillus TaxID=84406 RepID=A0A024QDD5_9BACI|nr:MULTISPECIES: SRPBCC family protein [Virgibacillus]EQB36778.1 hypothetical protein M948_17235 [Virgibacillus sp. CM-4]MYL42600.1 SRPBCC family protein [Virgibacillus massiliensis]GGJ73752.1 hypothetical protein GCM10007111_39230 [Virgibacillus kapii]CDQ40484.1 hypothetical protein BN990_02808 [Virgibacillus massiliensis]